MDRLVGSWLALAAVGAGIVHLALAWAAAGHLVGPQSVAGGALTGVLIVVGIAELSWGMVALIMGRPFAPDPARWAALAPVAGWALALIGGALVGDLALPFLPMGIATLFDLVIAAGLSVQLRTGQAAASHTSGSDNASMHPAFLLGLIAAALVSSALVAPALSETMFWRSQAPATQTMTPEHGSH